MAILTGGLFGKISGKIGGLVFSTRNNQTEVRSLPKKYEGPVTETALITRAKFKLLVEFLKLFTSFINIGFPKQRKQRNSAFNVAFKENYHCVIEGGYPNLEIDYSKIAFSKGQLDEVSGLKIERIDRRVLYMDWNFYSTPRGCDRIYCILYNATDKHVFEVGADAMISESYLLFFLPERMIGEKIHVYVFFHSSARKMVSNTQYQFLDLRELDPNEKNSSFGTSCGGDNEGVNTKKENLSKVIKHPVIPKAIAPKKKPGKTGRSVREYTGNVLNGGIGSRRKPIRQKRP
jgi:hypothetical protein